MFVIMLNQEKWVVAFLQINKRKLWLAKKEYLPETSNSLTSLEKAQLSHIPEKEQL